MNTLETKTNPKACPPMGRGSGLIFAVVLLFVILGMVITLSSITVLETKMSQKTKSSVGAFYNSESGVEWALNKIATGTGTTISNFFGATPPGNGFDCPTGGCKVYLLDKDGIVITSNLTIDQVKAVRSVGTQDTGEVTQRAIEAAVAAGEVGKYQISCFAGAFNCCRIDTETGTTVCYQWGSGGWMTWPSGNPINNPGNDALKVP